MEKIERINVLNVIIDCNPMLWGKRNIDNSTEKTIKFTEMLNHLLVFLNTYLMTKHHNRLSIILCGTKSNLIYPVYHKKDEMEIEEPQEIDKKKKKKVVTDGHFDHEISFPEVKRCILDGIKKLIISENVPSMPSAISSSLCFLNRLEKEKPLGTNLLSRILILSITPDVSAHYISMMNCIFCVQKMNTIIDSCVLGDDSSYLQQAAHITGGTYLKPFHQEGLLQYLLSVFLVERHLRSIVQMPSQHTIDLRASCFETRKQIDIGFVCSICLSIFANKLEECSTCKSKFVNKQTK
jgi:transcription initiation factor TFIIH subunit 3